MTKVLNRRSFFPGDIIFHEGDNGSQAFVVQSGRIRIVKALAGGEKGTLGFVEPGGVFGEMALLDNSPRMATAVAEEASVLIVIPESVVKAKLKKTNPVIRMMLVVMIRMLRNISEKVDLEVIDLEAVAQAAKFPDVPQSAGEEDDGDVTAH
ncbi:Crp/Fnr family transcriptional regulator [Aestuariispira insulae]|uniref:Cyclic nucleotide-binding domain-containing protein n=1 Tax=Aestuariispira insulae TaxID=1461337 RepID=A0A3D9HNG1_9PROT|nr:cyclic nucleotide-binding domain-containing protein [Aestuariispira insulae]RED51009.1 hypothetical protein DFP90_104285 [Aestuariispira insulae]